MGFHSGYHMTGRKVKYIGEKGMEGRKDLFYDNYIKCHVYETDQRKCAAGIGICY